MVSNANDPTKSGLFGPAFALDTIINVTTFTQFVGPAPVRGIVFGIGNDVNTSVGIWDYTIQFDSPVIDPIIHLINLDNGTVDFAGTTDTSGAAANISVLINNNELERSGTIFNSVANPAQRDGCETNAGVNPNGGCGSIRFNGVYQTINFRNTDQNLNTTAGDGWLLGLVARAFPTVTLTKVSNLSVGSFTFTGTNGWSSQTITTVTPGAGVAGATQTLSAASTVTDISETVPAGYTLTDISCSGLGSGTATPNLTGSVVSGIPPYSVRLDAAATAPDNSIACTFTNTLSTVDLSITKTNTPGSGPNDLANDTVTRGQLTTYRIVVTNNGPNVVTGATVTDSSSNLTCSGPGTGLTCTSSAGTTCPAMLPTAAAFASGTTVTLGALPGNGTVTFNLTCTVN